jgi:hypothetical protein
VAVLYGLALVTAYSAGVYFLFPYYSIQPGETHFNGPVPMTWADGEYLLSLKSTSTHKTTHARAARTHMPKLISAGFVSLRQPWPSRVHY